MGSKWPFWLILTLILLSGWLIRIGPALKTSLPSGHLVIETVLKTEPKRTTATQTFRLERVMVITKLYPELHFGDRVRLEGEVTDGIMAFPRVMILEPVSPENNLTFAIFRFRNKSFDIFAQSLPEPAASTLAGMVLGIDRIPADFVEVLRRSGLLHLVVVSGQNITLLAGFVLLLAGFIKRQFALVVSLLTIAVYTILAGAEPPVVRASLMAAFSYFGQFLGRQTTGLLFLVWSAVIMILLKPQMIFNLSFLLSFAATLGILVIAPLIKTLVKLPNFLGESVAVSLAAWLMTAPILLSAFGQLSVVAILANLLVSFTVLPLMVLGFVILAVGWLWPILAKVIALIAFPLIDYLILIATAFARLPFAQISLGYLPPIVILGYYLLLFSCVRWAQKAGFSKS